MQLKPTMSTLICLLMLLPPLSQSHAESYVGTWTAEFKGTTFMWLDLRMPNGALTGTISIGGMHVDEKGNVDAVRAPPDKREPITDFAVVNSRLTFTHKDGNDAEHFEMRLLDATTAELRFVLTREQQIELGVNNVHPPKPVRLKRVAR
jgi:hypothetical protein